MNIEFLHSFVMVAEAGSLAEAGRRLDLTPAAIAARLHALEEELGTTLVQRAGRSVRLTDAGLKILERSRSMLRDLRDLRAIAADSSLPGELRVGVFSSALTAGSGCTRSIPNWRCSFRPAIRSPCAAGSRPANSMLPSWSSRSSWCPRTANGMC